MSKSCAAGWCNNVYSKDDNLSFCVFPNKEKEPDRYKKWVFYASRINADGTPWQPTSRYTYLCGDHFMTGKAFPNAVHPDYVPNMPRKAVCETASSKLERFHRKERRACEKMVNTNQNEVEIAEGAQQTAQKEMEDCNNVENEVSEDQASSNELFLQVLNERDAAVAELNKCKFCVKNVIKENDNKCNLYTGIPWEKFCKLFEYLKDFVSQHGNEKLLLEDQFFLALIKLRQNIGLEILGDMFGIAKTTAWEIFWKWIDLLYYKIKFYIKFPDRENIFSNIPPVFKDKYPRLTGIIDCFEIFIDAPSNLKARSKTYSNYKKHCTVKYLICCNPLGAVSFLSEGFGGKASDNTITRESGFISSNLHFPGDQILADRGFTLQEDFATICGVELILPSFTRGKEQLSAQEVEYSRCISNVRIHIERIIGLIKQRFQILDHQISSQLVKSLSDEFDETATVSIDKIVTVCAALVNLGESIVCKNDK